jgi:hypothetical protein
VDTGPPEQLYVGRLTFRGTEGQTQGKQVW